MGNIRVLFAFLISQPILGVKAINLNNGCGKVNFCTIKGHVDF